MSKLRFVLLSLLFVLFSFVSRLNASELLIKAASFDRFGRIEFNWKSDVNYQVKPYGREIFISFSKVIDEDPDSLRQNLPNYISEVYLSSDLKTIVLKLFNDFQIRDFKKNGVIYVDIIGQGNYDIKDMINNLSKPKKSSLTRSLLLVPVAKKEVVLQQDAKQIEEQPKEVIKEVIKEVPKIIKKEPKKSSDKNKDFKYVSLRTAQHDDFRRFVFEWKDNVNFNLNEDINFVEIKFLVNAKISNPEIIKTLPEEYKNISYENKGGYLYFKIPLKDKATFKSMKLGKRSVFDVYLNEQDFVLVKNEDTKTADISFNADNKGPEIKKEEVKESAPLKVQDKVIEVNAIKEEKPFFDEAKHKKGNKIATIAMPFEKNYNMALFKRHGIWWIVFDGNLEVDTNRIKEKIGDIIKEISFDSTQNYSVVRMIIDDKYDLEVDKDNTTWVLNILDGYGFLNKDIEVVSQSGIYSGSKIYLPIREASQPIEIKDPEVGDSLKVICIAYAGFGVGSSKVYPDFEISKTSQGVVIALRDNDLDVAVSDFGVEIKKIDGGLKLSSIQKEIEEAKRKEEEPSQNKMSALKLLDISLLEYDDAKKYFKELGEIKREIYRLPKEIRNRARLKLARFYLANNMIPEALGVLDIIALNDETIKENPMYATLQGVTNALLNRYEDALKWFNVKSLEGNEEAKIWKAYIDVIQNDSIENMAKNYDIFKKNITYIIDYPSKIKNKIALQGLKIAVSEIDENMANDYINLINTDGMRGHQKAGISYYKGLMNEFSGHFEEAFTLFNEVANGENLFYRALANREKLKLEYKLNRIDHKEVLRQLEKLRYSWRGDKFEFDVMNDLVDLYISHGKYNEALSLLKDMMGIFKEEANNRHVKQRMEEIFDNLYLKGDADKLSPVKAIGIYQNFKEITPSGEKGNEMIRRLADRMVSVDLLDQASDLLKNQVEHRLEGREKAIIGARLALINIMNNKPAYALKVIEDTDYFDISNNLKWQRKLIKAKALSEMGKKDEAIKLVENDDTNDAKLLKTEILWSAKRWDEVSDVLRGMIKRPVKGEALEKGQADILIDWITALRLAGREKVLLRVRENFEPYVKGTRYYDTFNLLTDVSDKGTAFTGLSDQIKSAEGFKSFMNSYVDKMKQDGLSQTIK